MSERDIYMLGVRSVLDELGKRNSQAGGYMEGLVAGIEIGVSLDDKFDSQFNNVKTSVKREIDRHLRSRKTNTSKVVTGVIKKNQTQQVSRRRRPYEEAYKKQIVREVYECGFDLEGVRAKYNVFGKGTVYRWMVQYSEELGYDIGLFKAYQKNRRAK